MAIRRIPALLMVVVLGACGSGGGVNGDEPTPSPAETYSDAVAAPRTLTPADDGHTYEMAVGDVSALVVADPQEPEPQVVGSSVLVIPVVNVQASNQREWELRAVAVGRTTVTGTGPASFTLALDVVAATS